MAKRRWSPACFTGSNRPSQPSSFRRHTGSVLRALKNKTLWAIAAASFTAIFGLNLPFPAIVVAAAALIGYIGGRIAPETFRAGGGQGGNQRSFGNALIDDDTPTPEHARFTWCGLTCVAVVGSLLWIGPMALLTGVLGGITR